MAILPVRLDEPAANTSTRRALLSAIAAVPLLSISGRLPAMAINAEAVTWDRALAAWRAAEAAADYHHKHIYNVAHAKLDEIAPFRGLTVFRTALDGTVAKFEVDTARPVDDQFPFFDKRSRSEAAELLVHHRIRCEASDRLRIGLIADENYHLTCEAVEREAILMIMPAPHQNALRWKIEHLFRDQSRGRERESDTIIGEWCDVLTADARRILA